jgi:hypothetical protein
MVYVGRRLEVLTKILLKSAPWCRRRRRQGQDGAPHVVRSPLLLIYEPLLQEDARWEGDGVGEADLSSTTRQCCRSKSTQPPSLSERENGEWWLLQLRWPTMGAVSLPFVPYRLTNFPPSAISLCTRAFHFVPAFPTFAFASACSSDNWRIKHV